jgi:hypothetical protein
VVERRRLAQATLTAAVEAIRVDSVRRELREFWDEKRNDMGWATIYRFKPIGNGS